MTTSFEPNAIIRGAQLTVVGAYRALQNPGLFTSQHYRQAAIAVASGVIIRIIVEIPSVIIRILLWAIGLFVDLSTSQWDDTILEGLHFLTHSVLQVPFFLMTLMRHITPTLDQMFMESLSWVDRTYYEKHRSEDPTKLRTGYYTNLSMYSTKHASSSGRRPWDAAIATAMRYGKKGAISLAIYLACLIPYIGKLVLPAASFYTFNQAVGLVPAAVIFAPGILLPRRYLVVFLQSYFASRSLMRDLLSPYFSRVVFTSEQKRRWFREREGVLFGFGVGFFLFLKIPLLGVLIFGIAEASTAYLVTKITDPPPPPSQARDFAQNQIQWKNKHEFMNLPMAYIDALNVQLEETKQRRSVGGAGTSESGIGNVEGKKFT